MPALLMKHLLQSYDDGTPALQLEGYAAARVVEAVRVMWNQRLIRRAANDADGAAVALTRSGQVLLSTLQGWEAGRPATVWEWDGRDFEYPVDLRVAMPG